MEQYTDYNYSGPLRLYEKAGFEKAAEYGEWIIMRKLLKEGE